MKDISETHPSLNGNLFFDTDEIQVGNGDFVTAVEEIQKHTIDKAMLRENIRNICNKDHQNPDYWQCEMKILLEELELEKEK